MSDLNLSGPGWCEIETGPPPDPSEYVVVEVIMAKPALLPIESMRSLGPGRIVDIDELLLEEQDDLADQIAAKVLAGLRAPAPTEQEWLSTGEAAKVLGVDRGTLDSMVARAPRDLPGGPVHVGEGKARRHLRWPAEHLQKWADAFREWERTRGKRR